MQTQWFKDCTNAEQKEQRKKELLSYRNAFQALTALLEESFEEPSPDYDNPSWSHKQADVNGANRMLKKVLKLIDIKEK